MSHPFARARGMIRYLILYALKDGPLHGYGIMKKISELVSEFYTPSPGVIYPNLQLLEDLEYVESRYEGRRKVYTLTEKGRQELERNLDKVEKFINNLRNLKLLLDALGINELLDLVDKLVAEEVVLPKEVLKVVRTKIDEVLDILRKELQSRSQQ